MEKFEYNCVPIWGLGAKTTKVLNTYGAQGWELVSVFYVWHYFKSPIEK